MGLQTLGNKATPADISRFILREPHSVGALLRRMQKEGLVNLNKDTDRRNMIRVVMTENGQETYNKISSRESIRHIMSCLSEEEIKQMISYMRRIRDTAIKEARIDHEPAFP